MGTSGNAIRKAGEGTRHPSGANATADRCRQRARVDLIQVGSCLLGVRKSVGGTGLDAALHAQEI